MSAAQPFMDQFSKLSYLVLEANSQCNLACEACNRSALEERGLRAPRRLSAEELRFLLDQLRDCPIDTIKFEGLSEPMLHPEFDRLSEILREYFPRASIIIATNLQYNVPRSPLLRTLSQVDMVYLSIDGTGSIYEDMRAGARYSTLLASLKELEAYVPLAERKKKLFINFTATERNFRELPAMYELRDRHGLAGVRVNLAQNWDEDQLNPHRFEDELVEFLKAYRDDVKGVGGWDYDECFWPFNGIVIDCFGDVRQCIINTTMAPLGNAFRTPLREIYDAAAPLLEARQKLPANQAPRACVTCDYKHLAPILARILGGRHAVNKPRRKAI